MDSKVPKDAFKHNTEIAVICYLKQCITFVSTTLGFLIRTRIGQEIA